MKTLPHYKTHATDYLVRAEARLADGTEEALFYAALELRCGIEARMKQYLESQEDISKAKKSGWEIAKLGKGIEQAFRTGDKVIGVSILDEPNGKVLATFLYTPVTKRLQKLGQLLGNYLHPSGIPLQISKTWWEDFRKILNEGVELLRKATVGELLRVPLLHKKTGEIKMAGEFDLGDSRPNLLQHFKDSSTQIVVQVTYYKDFKLERVD